MKKFLLALLTAVTAAALFCGAAAPVATYSASYDAPAGINAIVVQDNSAAVILQAADIDHIRADYTYTSSYAFESSKLYDFTVAGSWVASLLPSATMGSFSVFMTFLLGIKFIVRPVMTTKEAMQGVSAKKRAIQSIVCGILIGFICGFIGAGGGMMMLLILTSVLGYELKTAVGTSVFIMTFTALTGAVSHFMIGGAPDWGVWVLCVLFTLLWARIAAVFANKATPKTLNRATGVVLVVLGIVIMGFKLLA